MAAVRIVSEDEIIETKHEGDIVVRDGAQLEVIGLVAGTITVEERSTLILRGVVMDLQVNQGGTAVLHGMVSGRLRAQRFSRVDIHSIVFGPVTADAAASITRHPGARVEGRLV